MVEVLFLILILAFCFFSNKNRIVYLLIALLPFHTFFKSCFTFFFNGGELFSYWKEIVVIILAFKAFIFSHLKSNRRALLLSLILMLIIFCYYIVSPKYKEALPTLRDHLIPLILFITIAAIQFEISNIKKIAIILSVVLFFLDITGFLQQYLLNIPISMLMGAIDYIDSDGYIQYKTSSYRIMGSIRMFGITSGPNIFGIFTAFGIVFLYGISVYKSYLQLSKVQIRLIWITIIISAICLILSFSRVGWFIAIMGITLLILSSFNWSKKIKYFISLSVLISLFISIFFLFLPNEAKIIYNSFTGKEASAADRGNSLFPALEIVLSEPWGHGIGTTDFRYNPKFFAESAFLNIAYEIGLLGLIYIILMQLLLIYTIKKISKNSLLKNIAVAISIPTLITCFVSINPYGMPYVYFWWLMLGLGMNKSISLQIQKS